MDWVAVAVAGYGLGLRSTYPGHGDCRYRRLHPPWSSTTNYQLPTINYQLTTRHHRRSDRLPALDRARQLHLVSHMALLADRLDPRCTGQIAIRSCGLRLAAYDRKADRQRVRNRTCRRSVLPFVPVSLASESRLRVCSPFAVRFVGIPLDGVPVHARA